MTSRKRPKKLKAYEYDTFPKARARGYTLKQWKNSKIAKKRYDNLSELQKEIQLENLAAGRRKLQLKRKFEKQKLEQKRDRPEDFVEVYEIVSQSHYYYRKKGKKTDFEYSLVGYFENEPNINTIEKMSRNSLIAAFNSGKKGSGGYLKQSVFNELVTGQMRGVKINKVLKRKDELFNINRVDAELQIINNGKKWIGRN